MVHDDNSSFMFSEASKIDYIYLFQIVFKVLKINFQTVFNLPSYNFITRLLESNFPIFVSCYIVKF